MSAASPRVRESSFLVVMTTLMTMVVLVGFGRTWFLRFAFMKDRLPGAMVLHGIAFTAWIALFGIQIVLVRTHNVALHRRLGWVGAGLALLMAVFAFETAMVAVRRDLAANSGTTEPLSFLAIPFGDLAVFLTLVAFGIVNRSRADVHKRLMLLATIALLPAALARFPFAAAGSAYWYYGAADLLVLCCIAFDWLARHKVHRAFLYGGALMVATQPLRFLIGGTGTWIALMRKLV